MSPAAGNTANVTIILYSFYYRYKVLQISMAVSIVLMINGQMVYRTYGKTVILRSVSL
jgi:hypothetical protein